jgi:putative transposase
MNEHEHSSGSTAPSRERVRLEAGAYVRRGDAVYRITRVLDFATVIGVDLQTGRAAPLAVADLRPLEEGRPLQADLEEIADADWRKAEQRFAAIQPLTGRHLYGREEVEARAREVGVSPATL